MYLAHVRQKQLIAKVPALQRTGWLGRLSTDVAEEIDAHVYLQASSSIHMAHLSGIPGTVCCLWRTTARCQLTVLAWCQPSSACLHSLGAEVCQLRDRVRDSVPGRPLQVWLVKADASAGPLTVRCARKLLQLDVYRRILNDSKDTSLLHVWGFTNSSPKTVDVESDLMVLLSSLGVQKPHHMYRNEQLHHVEQTLSRENSMILDLSASENDATGVSETAKTFLQTHPARLLRLSALLESGDIVGQSEGVIRFYGAFLSAVDDYLAKSSFKSDSGSTGCDSRMFELFADQEVTYYGRLYDFETRKALDVLWETMLLLKAFIVSDERERPSALGLLALKHRLLRHLATLGITLDDESAQPATDARISTIIDATVAFRQQVRRFALQDREQRAELMVACDDLRNSLLKAGVKLQDKKNQAPWLWTTPSKR